jgi:flagellar basal-body rod protein FlgC
MSLLATFNIGSTGMTAQAMRLNVTASNIANAESMSGPDGRPYCARQVEFMAVRQPGSAGSGVEVSKVLESDAPLRMEYRPGHPKANNAGYVEMPNVNPVEEMVNMISASRSYQMNVEAMNVSRVLLLKTLDMGK